LKSIRKAKTW